MTRPVDVAVLGVGNIGLVHLQSALAMDDVRVAAVADAEPANRRLAEQRGVPETFEDFRPLLSAVDVDVVVVALPPFLHAEAVECAAEHGCHVFVEKPFARSTDEAAGMIETADEAGVRLGVDHTIRYLPEVRRMEAAYAAGRVGHVPMATISRVNNGPFDRPPVTAPLPGWQLHPEAAGGGALLDLGLHLFDVVEWCFGRMELLDATTSRQLDLPFEDAATVLLRSTETDTVVTMHCGTFQWEDLPDLNFTFRMEGVAGTLESGDYAPDDFYAHAARSALGNLAKRLRNEEIDHFAPTYYLQAHYDALAGFVDAVREGEDPPVTGANGYRALELAERAYDAAGDHEAAAVDRPATSETP